MSEIPNPPRNKMPNRRETETLSFEHGELEYRASIGRFEDGRLSEVFLVGGKSGSAASIMSNEASVVLSIALQYGIPLKVLRAGLPKLKDGKPAGPLGKAIVLFEGPIKKHAAAGN